MRVTAFRAVVLAAFITPVALSSQDQTVRIRAAKVLDGTGKVLSNVTITVNPVATGESYTANAGTPLTITSGAGVP